jgi:hypothetical protein
MKTSARIHESIGAVSLLALTMLVTRPEHARAHTSSSLPPDEHMIVTPADWLDGHGVGVYYPPHPYDDHPQNSDGRIQYECVELVFRLYDKLGYPAHWPIMHTYEIVRLPAMPGFKDLVFLSNDGPVAPRLGDVVVWPGWYNGGTGHVAVVSRIFGEMVQVVHQNVWRGSHPFPFTHLALHLNEHGHYRLISRDGILPLGWIHSPRTEGWFGGQRPIAALEGSNLPALVKP